MNDANLRRGFPLEQPVGPDDGDKECASCGLMMSLPGDLEPTGVCNLCAQDAYARMRETLQGIADADWRKWEELASPDEFVRWAQSRARHALQPNFVLGDPPKT